MRSTDGHSTVSFPTKEHLSTFLGLQGLIPLLQPLFFQTAAVVVCTGCPLFLVARPEKQMKNIARPNKTTWKLGPKKRTQLVSTAQTHVLSARKKFLCSVPGANLNRSRKTCSLSKVLWSLRDLSVNITVPLDSLDSGK